MLPSSGTALAVPWPWPKRRSLTAFALLETKMQKVDSFLENFDKTLEVRFRAQAEMLDERFVESLRGDGPPVYSRFHRGDGPPVHSFPRR